MCQSVVISAGGTGGHLFPAQALADELCALSDVSIHFMAKGLTFNRHFDKTRFPYTDVSSAPIGLKACFSITRGIIQSLKKLRVLRPALVVGFGSYHSFPVLCAAYLLNIPIVLHEANRAAGRVNRLFSPVAAWTGIYFPDTKLKGLVCKTDIPLRPHFAKERWPTKEKAYARYKLSPKHKTILVFGGSLGAKKLNCLAQEAIGALNNDAVQVLHFTGCKEASYDIAKGYEEKDIRSFVSHFEEEMPYAWSIADIAICRAGASTVYEQLLFAVPALFIPFPFAQDAHQDKNAAFVQEVVGGAKMCIEKETDSVVLSEHIQEMLEDEKLRKMRHNIQAYQQTIQGDTFSKMIHRYLTTAL